MCATMVVGGLFEDHWRMVYTPFTYANDSNLSARLKRDVGYRSSGE